MTIMPRNRGSVAKPLVSRGTAHAVPSDVRLALVLDVAALAAWNGLTPLARNEWICWVASVRLRETRADHVRRLVRELNEGKRRPCCWIGCVHRADKAVSPSVRAILARRKRIS